MYICTYIHICIYTHLYVGPKLPSSGSDGALEARLDWMQGGAELWTPTLGGGAVRVIEG